MVFFCVLILYQWNRFHTELLVYVPRLIVEFSGIRIETGKTGVIKPFFPIPGRTVEQTAVT